MGSLIHPSCHRSLNHLISVNLHPSVCRFLLILLSPECAQSAEHSTIQGMLEFPFFQNLAYFLGPFELLDLQVDELIISFLVQDCRIVCQVLYFLTTIFDDAADLVNWNLFSFALHYKTSNQCHLRISRVFPELFQEFANLFLRWHWTLTISVNVWTELPIVQFQLGFGFDDLSKDPSKTMLEFECQLHVLRRSFYYGLPKPLLNDRQQKLYEILLFDQPFAIFIKVLEQQYSLRVLAVKAYELEKEPKPGNGQIIVSVVGVLLLSHGGQQPGG